MGEEQAQSYFAAAGIFLCGGDEFGDDGGDGSVEIKQAALVEEHGHCGGGDYFG